MLVFGAILIATMLFGEGGLAALCAATGRRLRGWLLRFVPKLAPSDEGAR
jgi:hypothetical protein